MVNHLFSEHISSLYSSIFVKTNRDELCAANPCAWMMTWARGTLTNTNCIGVRLVENERDTERVRDKGRSYPQAYPVS